MQIRALFAPALLTFALALGACAGTGGTDAGGDGDGDGDAGPDFDQAEADVIAAVATFETQGFTKVNDMVFETAHAASTHANVWVSNAHVAAYKELDPTDDMDTHAEFPVGMIVIKDQVDADGANTGGYLVMSKFDEGYDADNNDWWWGMFTAVDTPSNNTGRVGFCITCHKDTYDLADTDYMLGVDPANQL